MATLIIPLRSLLGLAGVPGEAAGFGPVETTYGARCASRQVTVRFLAGKRSRSR
jgi:hypothetical protein